MRTAWEQGHGAPALRSRLRLPAVEGEVELDRVLRYDASGGEHVRVHDPSGAAALLPVRVAPDEESGLADAVAALPESGAVVVAGPPGLTRTRLAEEARLVRGLVTVQAGPDLADPAAAETVLLSGRADAVAVPEGSGS